MLEPAVKSSGGEARVAPAIPVEVLGMSLTGPSDTGCYGIDDASEDMARTVYDSRLDPDLASATRSSTATHLLVLRSSELCIELECFGSTVVGQLVPPSSAQVELIGTGGPGSRTAETDPVGGFVFDQRTGPFRLRARTGTGRTLETQWLPMAG
jgi:hypothetical protein